MPTLSIGIASYDEMKARTLVIARANVAYEPKTWFTSMESLAKVLSDRNRALLALIVEAKPGSPAGLASLSGRATSNLSRTLKTMARYDLVELEKGEDGTLIPRVPYTAIALEVAVGEGGRRPRIHRP